MTNTYEVIFFDLDRTLWDFEANSKEALREIYFENKLDRYVTTPERFIEKFKKVNEFCWEQYRFGKISKENLRWERFYRTLHDFGYDLEVLSKSMGEAYVAISPTKKRLLPGALELLDYLKEKGYRLFIITNGFQEVQEIKMKQSGLSVYFDGMITSEMANAKKPAAKIFDLALDSAKVSKEKSIYIGDEVEIDVLGAVNFGMPCIWFNPNKDTSEKLPEGVSQVSKLIDLKLVF
jgi:putative hydrolase of the HAD superfamily